MAESDIFVSNDIALDVDFGEIFVVDQGVVYKVIAKKYSSEKTYAVGDYVSHLEKLYRCITAVETAEAFDEEKWTEVFLADEVQIANNNIALKANAADVYAKTDTYNKTEVNEALAEKVDSDDLAEVATSGDYSDLSNTPNLATVATSGSYDDLTDKPVIPAAQVNSDWNAASGVAQILNKPSLATVATSGSYNDLSNKPSIPAAQVNSDWDSESGVSKILNKPNLATVATTGDYSDLSGTPDLATVATSGSYDDLTDKPTIPAAQVQADYGQTDNTKIDYIKNKPNLATVATSGDYNDLTNKPTIPAAQVNSDWEADSGVAKILNKPNLAAVATSGDYEDLSNAPALATVATSGDYDDLSNKPTIPAAQVNSDWNASSGVAQILNKPTIPTVNDATITVVQGSTTKGTFTLNQSANATITLDAGGSGGASTLDDLTDVDITNPTTNQILKYNGTSWVNGTGGGSGAEYVELTQSEYDALTPAERMNGTMYFITDSSEGGSCEHITLTQAKYDALVVAGRVDPDAFYFISDASFPSYAHNYSTDEQIVGTWIDGSTIYEKTLVFNNKLVTNDNSTSELVHGISNLGTVSFIVDAYYDFTSGGTAWATGTSSVLNYKVSWKLGSTSIYMVDVDQLSFSANPDRYFMFVVRYTKSI